MRWFEEQRIEWIDRTVHEVGYINRSDIMKRFRISEPQASKDLATYKRLHPGVLNYNLSLRRYELDREHRASRS